MQGQILAQSDDDLRQKRANTLTAIIGGSFAFLGLEVMGIPAFSIASACGLGVAGLKGLKVYREYRKKCHELNDMMTDTSHTDSREYDEEKDRYYQAKAKKLDDMKTAWAIRVMDFTRLTVQKRLQASGETSYPALIAIARRTYGELEPPIQLVHDWVDELVFFYMYKNHLLASPLPSHWEHYDKYREYLGNSYTYGLMVDDQDNVQTETMNVLDDDPAHVQDGQPRHQDDQGNAQAESGDVQTQKKHVQDFDSEILEAIRTADGILGRDKLKIAYKLYDQWIERLEEDEKILTERGGLEFVRSKVATTKAGAEAIQRIWKLRAVKSGILKQNPRYTGKPPHPEFLKVA